MEEMKFNAFVPMDLKKSIDTEDDTNKYSIVSGWASTPAVDLQNDIINPKGIDIEYFKKNGYINYEHQQDNVVGIPTDNCYVDLEKGLFIEAKLWKDDENVIKMLDLAEKLEKSGSGRRLGFSIEGAVKKRNINDNRIVDELMITGVALVKNPANPEATWESFVKSFLTGTETTPDTQVDAGALRKESLASSITNLTYVTKIKDVKEYNDIWNNVVEDLTKSNNMGYEESVITLQLAKGLSRKDAEIAVMSINKKNLE
ncbi:prohead protease [Staphylococcus phage vB_SauH_SPJ2]|uniref:Prohead protease n=6 Tax=Silviavirus TaxID=1857889 RepID=S4T8Q8_9CAUD|nr:head maturation protease [Staphylococcus phage SA11]YP_007677513.1 prohead protease [Staphylococcus phage vB_SauM_Romulus]YP_008431143.1 head maturation protease [Staphylococcus phage vB_SauM_Remus]APC42905.1 hypothetical protein SAP1_040 [Staphylococcus phage StAP1]QQO38144.1 hypothetical protein LSA2308_00124 [Staphylococcus phage LSA2308]QVD57658.1 prohead protease [Staphylococcus phage PM56]QVD58551.1 prohead protease [Staphylococcus phage PM93]QVD58754.1 prohead protease [Silviavirus